MKKILILVFTVFLVDAATAQWQQTQGPYVGNVTSFTRLDPALFAGTQYGCFQSTDGGMTWTAMNPLTDNFILSLATFGSRLIAGTNDFIFYSDDYGVSWTQASVTGNAYNFQSIAFNDSTGYAAALTGLFASGDSGATWSKIDLGANFYPYSVVTSGDTIVAGGTTGIFFSQDNGLTWTFSINGLVCSDIHCLAIKGDTIFAGSSGGGIYLSADYGASWVSKSAGLTTLNINSIAVNNDSVYAGLFDQGVFVSGNNGDCWEEMNDGLPDNCTVAAFTFAGDNVLIGTWYNSIWYHTLLPVVVSEKEVPSGQLNIIPNPATDKVVITIPKENEASTITIYSANGVEVMTLPVNGHFEKIRLNISRLPRGVYYVNVFGNKAVASGKLIKE